MTELIKYIVQNLVEDKEAVQVSSREEEKAVVVEVTVSPNDTGKMRYAEKNMFIFPAIDPKLPFLE